MKKRTSKKKPSYLRLVTGESNLSPARKAWVTRKAEKLAKDKDVQVLVVDKPLIAVVSSQDLDPAKGLRASDYIHRTHHENKVLEETKGRSRIYPEINVLNSAKAWHQSMIRLARREGYYDVKKFFKESDLVTPDDKRLFDAVEAFKKWEQG